MDGQISPDRVAQAIDELQADVVGLQEVDVGRRRSGEVDQSSHIAEMLGMEAVFQATVRVGAERYGNAVLSRLPIHLVKAEYLPVPRGHSSSERRGAIWVKLHDGLGDLHVVSTHLGLDRRERIQQAAALLGKGWLGDLPAGARCVLCGDFNSRPGSPEYEMLDSVFTDTRRSGDSGWLRATWPSLAPVMSIDHVFASPAVEVHRVQVPFTRLTRVASDHLPVVVTLSGNG